MAISAQGMIGSSYDLNRDRDMYYSQRDMHEREMHYRRQQEEEYRRMQNSYFNSAQQPQLVNPAPKPDLKDPLAFLTKTDNKILLTGEAP